MSPASVHCLPVEAGFVLATLTRAGVRTSALRRRLHVEEVDREPVGHAGTECVVLRTARGDITTCLHPPAVSELHDPALGVIFVAGAGGGLEGPADALYPDLCEELRSHGVAALRVDYRFPNNLPECVLDALLSVRFLRNEGVTRIAIVGHSFGGAVAIAAGALSTDVHAVATLSTQTYGADLVGELTPRPLLVLHGTADEVLPSVCSELVYAAAAEPRELRLLPGARHDLRDARAEILRTLAGWLPAALDTAAPPRRAAAALELREL